MTITGDGSTRKTSDYRDDLLCWIRIIRGLVCQQTNFAGASISKINSHKRNDREKHTQACVNLLFVCLFVGATAFFLSSFFYIYNLCCHQHHSKDCLLLTLVGWFVGCSALTTSPGGRFIYQNQTIPYTFTLGECHLKCILYAYK